MVTSPHEASHRIFQERPEILTPAFRILGVRLPDGAAVEVLSPDTTEIRPVERRVDGVLRVKPPNGSAFMLAIEAQSRKDAAKVSSWAYYLAHLQAKYSLPALLLVVCQDKATATWAAGPFDLGLEDWTALTLRPLVLGPGNVPLITDAEEAARNLPMAAFAAMTHSRNSDPTAILEALATAVGRADEISIAYYWQMLELGLGDGPTRKTWRDMMKVENYFPGRGTLVEESILKGKAEGKAEERAGLILRLLDQRGIPVPPGARERVTACADLDTLGRWLDRAFTAASTDELFGDDSEIPVGEDGSH